MLHFHRNNISKTKMEETTLEDIGDTDFSCLLLANVNSLIKKIKIPNTPKANLKLVSKKPLSCLRSPCPFLFLRRQTGHYDHKYMDT